MPNDELTVEQARALLHASTEEDALLQAWQNANSSPRNEATYYFKLNRFYKFFITLIGIINSHHTVIYKFWNFDN